MRSHLRSFAARLAPSLLRPADRSSGRWPAGKALVLAAALLCPNLAVAQTQDFDGSGTPYAPFIAAFGSNQTPPTVTPGGPTGNFLRLATTPATHITTITFDPVAGVADQVVIDFDFRMISPGARGAAADGIGVAFANADRFPSGPIPASLPDFGVVEQSVGIGIRTWGGNFVDVNFGSAPLARLDVSSWLDLVTGSFIHAQITNVRSLSAFEQFVRQPGNHLVSYSPTNFNPARLFPGGPLQQIPPASSITQDLVALRPAFNGLILYGSQTDRLDNGQPLAEWIVSEAKRLGFGAVMLGVWNPKDDAEVDAAAGLVNRYGSATNFAIGVCLGNEGIRRLDQGGDDPYDIPDLDGARVRLLAQVGSVPVPVVTSEDLARYRAPGHRALLSWGSFLFPVIVPHWNVPQLGPAAAAAWVRQQGALLADDTGVPVLVKEAGWPSGQAEAYTPETQWQFFAAYLAGPQTVESAKWSGVYTAFNAMLEAFDQPWKSAPDFMTWGLMTAGRVPKPAFSLFTASAPWGSPVDIDGDGISDIAIFRPSTGGWWVLKSSGNFATYSAYSWGVPGDVPVPGEYDGDGKLDLAIYRPTTGQWWILWSSTNFTTYNVYGWGLGGDTPVPADYDGDGKTDLAIFRPTTGEWWVLKSGTGYATYSTYGWGLPGDIPVHGDFDGDGKADPAIYRPTTGGWWLLKSSTNYATYSQHGWGLGGDTPVPADYDGDGKTDIAVYRPSTGGWWILWSRTNYATYGQYGWGLNGDIPVPGDYDGDGKTDIAIYRPTTAGWWILKSSTGFSTYTSYAWGLGGDLPL